MAVSAEQIGQGDTRSVVRGAAEARTSCWWRAAAPALEIRLFIGPTERAVRAARGQEMPRAIPHITEMEPGSEGLSERFREMVPWRATPYVTRGTAWQECGLRNGFKTRRQKVGVKFA